MEDFILFVDTETSGLPKNWDKPTVEQWPYIVQVAWVIFNKEGEEVKRENHYIRDEKITIDPQSEKIHGITQDTLMARGEKRVKVLKKLSKDLKYYKPLLVGHLIEFDKQMLGLSLQRAGLRNDLNSYPSFCTMRSNAHYMRLSNQAYPKLGELYQTLFGKPMEGQHDALSDCLGTATCFFELVLRNEVTDRVILQQQKEFAKRQRRRDNFGCGLPVLLWVAIAITYCMFYL